MKVIGQIIATFWPWLGNLLVAMAEDDARQKTEAVKAQGATEQVARDSAAVADAQERIGHAEANADRTQEGIVDAARKGDF
jgi:hypothetical protein